MVSCSRVRIRTDWLELHLAVMLGDDRTSTGEPILLCKVAILPKISSFNCESC